MRTERVLALLIATFIALLLASAGHASGPIGTLKSDQPFEIRAEGEDRATRLTQDDYTFFSGDTVIARAGPAVLNLTGGGGLGVTRGSEVEVRINDDGLVEARLVSGSILYAFPDGRHRFRFHAGSFTAVGSAEQVRAMQVASGDASVGTLELLEDGNIHASVREGSLFITNGTAVRYRVEAGETVGLLDLPGRTIRTQGVVPTSTPVPPILIQSPEQVGTNEDFLVRWEASDPVQGDYVVIAEEGAPPDEFESVISSDEGNVLEFEAPGDPGDYEIRFIDGESGAIKRFVYLDVVEGIIGAYWWNDPIVRGTMGVVAGATAIYIGTRIVDDDDPEPASP